MYWKYFLTIRKKVFYFIQRLHSYIPRTLWHEFTAGVSSDLISLSFSSLYWLDTTHSLSRGTSRLRAWTRMWRNMTRRGCFIGARPKTSRRSSWCVLPLCILHVIFPWHSSALWQMWHVAEHRQWLTGHFNTLMRCLTCHLYTENLFY